MKIDIEYVYCIDMIELDSQMFSVIWISPDLLGNMNMNICRFLMQAQSLVRKHIVSESNEEEDVFEEVAFLLLAIYQPKITSLL